MALQSPTAQHLRQLAEAHRFELGEDELAAFQSLLPGIFTARRPRSTASAGRRCCDSLLRFRCAGARQHGLAAQASGEASR
jgi:hypothetical protein